MTDCPQCAAYRALLAAETRVSEAQVDLLEALFLGVQAQETAVATLKHSMMRALELAHRRRGQTAASGTVQ
jgi:hypothetical protein